MNYSIQINWTDKSVTYNGGIIFKANDKDYVNSLSNIYVSSGQSLAYFQNINNLNDILIKPGNFKNVKENLLKLNNALKNAFVPEEFQKEFNKDVDNVSELEAYQNLAMFLYTIKRAIMIAHIIIVLKENTQPADNNTYTELKDKEERLTKFLNDSVKLVLNTNELIMG